MTRVATLLVVLSYAVIADAQSAAPPPFEIHPFHSQVEFSVPFMGLSRVKGGFEDFEGALLYDPSRPDSSAIVVVISTASLHTGNSLRDRHLKSSDFLDVERFPTIRFESTRITPTGADSYDVTGMLSIHGVSRPFVVPVKMRHALVRNANGFDYLGFDVALRMNWRDFGIRAGNENNSWFQPSTMLVSDSMDVAINIEAERRVGSRMQYPALAAVRQVASQGAAALSARYERLKAQSPDSLPPFLRALPDVADEALENGRHTVAISALTALSREQPNSSVVQIRLARALLAAGRREEAAAAYRRALALDPNDPTAPLMLSRLQPSR